ncbi:MAG: hypothetical protein ACFB02_03370 [Mastigocoleus sp.]
MKLIALPPIVAHAELRALKTIASENGELEDLELKALQAIQTHVLNTNFDIHSLEAIAHEELAEIVTEYKFREHLIHNCILISLIDGKVTSQKTHLVNNFAKALNINDKAIKTLNYLSNGHFLLVRLNIFRYAYIGPKLIELIRNQGINSIIPIIKYLINQGDTKTASRYRQLHSYPDGSLGKEFYNFIHKNNFGLPGERGKKPEIIVVHDCAHILGGYNTSVSEEVQLSAFQSGYLNRSPFWGLLFTILQLHLGVKVLTGSYTCRNQVEPESFFKAFKRGTQVNVDLFDNWDPWTVFHRQVEDLRKEYNILPRS